MIIVFVVDDHPLLRDAIRALIEDAEDMEVAGEAGSGEQALSCDSLPLADVVLCDVVLPGIDGVETTRRIKAANPDIKVIMLSAYGEYLKPALKAGAFGYIFKDTIADELIDHIRTASSGDTPISPSLLRALVSETVGGQDSAASRLTDRQVYELHKAAAGFTNSEIAAGLSVGLATVNRDMHGIFLALGVRSRTHAVSEAKRLGFL